MIKSLAKAILYSQPVSAALRQWQPYGLRVLTYHRFPAQYRDDFEQHCRHLKAAYNTITLDEAVEALRNRSPLPPRSLVVTIDDGYRDVYSVAYPVFRKYGVPFTVYAVSGFLDRECWLWWDILEYAFRHTGEKAFTFTSGETVALGAMNERAGQANRLAVSLISAPDCVRVETIRDICEQLKVAIPPQPTADFEALTWEEAREMSQGVGTIGSHTMYHPILSTLTDADRRKQEICGSKKRLEEQLQADVKHFCFPNGGAADFTHFDMHLIKSCGYESAATTAIGFNFPGVVDAYNIRRISVNPGEPFWWFHTKVAGLWRLRAI
jgi:peptidoglycan/xylan/chitin deacetylase (PgdA/CDA1 family)